MKAVFATTMFLAAMVSASSAGAALIISAEERGPDVEFTWSGSLDVAGVSVIASDISSLAGQVIPSTGWFLGYSPIGSQIDLAAPSTLSPAMLPFGSGGAALASGFSGSPFGLDQSGRIGLPAGYVSSTPLSGSLTFDDATFASLGLDFVNAPYVWTLPSGDTVELDVSASVPEPSTTLMLGLGLAVVGLGRRRS